MFNPGKTTKDIKSFYVNADTNLPVEEEKKKLSCQICFGENYGNDREI
jgi:hypothetical protein